MSPPPQPARTATQGPPPPLQTVDRFRTGEWSSASICIPPNWHDTTKKSTPATSYSSSGSVWCTTVVSCFVNRWNERRAMSARRLGSRPVNSASFAHTGAGVDCLPPPAPLLSPLALLLPQSQMLKMRLWQSIIITRTHATRMSVGAYFAARSDGGYERHTTPSASSHLTSHERSVARAMPDRRPRDDRSSGGERACNKPQEYVQPCRRG